MNRPQPPKAFWHQVNTWLAILATSVGLLSFWWALQMEGDKTPPTKEVFAQAWYELPPTVIAGSDKAPLTDETVQAASAWRKISLPARRCKISKAQCFDVYRTTFEPVDGDMAVYIPRYAGSIQIRLNGNVLANYGDITAPTDLHFVPQFTLLPTSLLATSNTLDIIVTNEHLRYHQLNPFYVGLHSELESAFKLTHFLSVSIPGMSIGIYSVLGLLSLLVFILGGRGPLYGWFFLITFFASLRALYFTGADFEPFLFRGGLYFFGSLGSLATIYIFSRRLHTGFHPSDYWVLGMTVLTAAVITTWDTLYPPTGNYIGNVVVRLSAIGFGALTTFHLSKYFIKEWHFLKIWLLLLFVSAFLLVLHDTIPALYGQQILVQLSNLSPLLVVLAFCLIAGQRFSDALNKANAYNSELESEVNKAKLEMAQAYAQLAEVQAREEVARERNRIMREVHDGVGGKLTGVLFMAKNPDLTPQRREQIAQSLEESLLDLRAIINALDDELSQDFEAALQNFEAQVRPWLLHSGVRLDIESNECALTEPVTSDWLLNVFRILQEALSNVVKHAQADRVRVRLHTTDTHLHITVNDNGIGFNNTPFGRGLKNLRTRCSALSGDFKIEGSEYGTQLTIKLALPPIT